MAERRLPSHPLIGHAYPDDPTNREMMFDFLAYWTGDRFGQGAIGIYAVIERDICWQIRAERFIYPE